MVSCDALSNHRYCGMGQGRCPQMGATFSLYKQRLLAIRCFRAQQKPIHDLISSSDYKY